MIQLNETENGQVLTIRQETDEEYQEIVYNLINATLYQLSGGKLEIDCQTLSDNLEVNEFFKYALLSLCKMYHDFLEDADDVNIINVMHRLNELVIDDLMQTTAEMTASKIIEQIERLSNEDTSEELTA